MREPSIIEEQYVWARGVSERADTKYIVLHHEAGWGSAQKIHLDHVNQGWTGIGYNFYVRQDGSIYRGRPIWATGAHAEGYNSISIGICAEGYYHPPNNPLITPDTEMPAAQLQSMIELVAYCHEQYPDAEIVGHRDLMPTACPGDYFPFEQIKEAGLNGQVGEWPVDAMTWAQLKKLINFPHDALELVMWGPMATVFNRYQGRSSMDDEWDPTGELVKLTTTGLINNIHGVAEKVTWGQFATVLNRLRGVEGVSLSWNPVVEIGMLSRDGLINSPHEPVSVLTWAEFVTVLQRL